MHILYIPCKNKEEATHISMRLLEKKLIACSNVVAATSLFWWEGKIETEDEHIIIGKTFSDKYDAVVKEVEQLHSYDCPCIVAFKIDKINKKYQKYVEKQIRD
jgi:periplasmic divalent cation tolerance protein